MPLFDSLSAGAAKFHRLSKMSSIPTTDDLRYALEEAKKLRKPVELPFEHPHNRQVFLVRVQLGVNTAPPTWSFLRGDGANAKLIWSRPTVEVMTIQNKISTESNRVNDQASTGGHGQYQGETEGTVQEPAPVHQFELGGPTAAHAAQAPQRAPAHGGFNQTMTGGFNPFDGSAPAPPPGFNFQSQGAAPMEETPVQPAPVPQAAQKPTASGSFPSIPDDEFQLGGPVAEPALADLSLGSPELEPQPASAPPPAPAPQPQSQTGAQAPVADPRTIVWDTAGMQTLLSDPATGMMSMQTFVFFLLRAWEHFRKDQTPCAVVVYEIAIRYPEGDVVPLPAEALVPLSRRLLSACSPLDVMAHVHGGEFIVVLPSTSAAAVTEFCNRLHHVLSETPLLPSADGQDLAMISIGAASLPEHSPNPEVLIHSARSAKERAKQSNVAYMVGSS